MSCNANKLLLYKAAKLESLHHSLCIFNHKIMAYSLYESVFSMIFMAMTFTTLKFVESSLTSPPPNAAAVDCQCEHPHLSPPPPPATITCPPSMPPPPPATPHSNSRPSHSQFSPPTIVYSYPPSPSVPSKSPCDIPSPLQCPWKYHPLPDLEFASAASLMKSALLTPSLISVVFMFTSYCRFL